MKTKFNDTDVENTTLYIKVKTKFQQDVKAELVIQTRIQAPSYRHEK